jgi:hypothetical protein
MHHGHFEGIRIGIEVEEEAERLQQLVEFGLNGRNKIDGTIVSVIDLNRHRSLDITDVTGTDRKKGVVILGIVKVVPDIRDLHGGHPDFDDILVRAHKTIAEVRRGIHKVSTETAVYTDNMLSEIIGVHNII